MKRELAPPICPAMPKKTLDNAVDEAVPHFEIRIAKYQTEGGKRDV
jgi:hypothetical protein